MDERGVRMEVVCMRMMSLFLLVSIFSFSGDLFGASPASPRRPVTLSQVCPDLGAKSMRSFEPDLFEDPTEQTSSLSRALDMLPPEGQHYTRKITETLDAWRITEGRGDIVVALIDSGMDYSHPDLKDAVWTNTKEANGLAGVDDDGNGYVDDVHGWDFVLNKPMGPVDGTGHGTHCAGNIAAAKNGFGVVGVAPGVKVMPVRFLNDKGSGFTANAIKAILYAYNNGAHVISNSWGGSKRNACLEATIRRVIWGGALFIASANNNGRNTDWRKSYPANYPGVIAVGNSDINDQKTKSSNYGKNSVFIFAPGTKSLSTHKNHSYRELTGTSMAAPQVAGALALGLSLNPYIETSDVKEMLCQTADRGRKLRRKSKCGRLNVGDFVKKVSRF